jgi:hypothetical protein
MLEPQTIMSQETYQERKASLRTALAGAQQEYRKAAYREEVGEADAGSAAEARRAVEDVEARIEGLEMAWQEAERQRAALHVEADQAQRCAALDRVSRHLKAREKAARAIEKALAPLEEAYRQLQEAGDAIVQEMKPFASHFGPDHQGFRLFRDTVQPEVRLEGMLISGTLYGAGIDLTGVSGQHAWFRVQERGLVEYVRMLNGKVLREASVIAPAEREEA